MGCAVSKDHTQETNVEKAHHHPRRQHRTFRSVTSMEDVCVATNKEDLDHPPATTYDDEKSVQRAVRSTGCSPRSGASTTTTTKKKKQQFHSIIDSQGEDCVNAVNGHKQQPHQEASRCSCIGGGGGGSDDDEYMSPLPLSRHYHRHHASPFSSPGSSISDMPLRRSHTLPPSEHSGSCHTMATVGSTYNNSSRRVSSGHWTFTAQDEASEVIPNFDSNEPTVTAMKMLLSKNLSPPNSEEDLHSLHDFPLPTRGHGARRHSNSNGSVGGSSLLLSATSSPLTKEPPTPFTVAVPACFSSPEYQNLRHRQHHQCDHCDGTSCSGGNCHSIVDEESIRVNNDSGNEYYHYCGSTTTTTTTSTTTTSTNTIPSSKNHEDGFLGAALPSHRKHDCVNECSSVHSGENINLMAPLNPLLPPSSS